MEPRELNTFERLGIARANIYTIPWWKFSQLRSARKYARWFEKDAVKELKELKAKSVEELLEG